MNKKKVLSRLEKKVLILDGAMGTQLQRMGMPQGVSPELWATENPQVLKQIHHNYSAAGAEIIYTCTFGANRVKLNQYKINQSLNVFSINKRLAQIAKSAVSRKCLVAGDIGPTGKFIAPFGKIGFEEAVNIFKEQIRGLLAGGVDLLVIETMIDIQETRAALIAAGELTDRLTMVSMTYEKDGNTLNGTNPISALITLQSLGAGVVGCNCSSGPNQMVSLIKKMKPYAKVPLLAKPNAGMPQLKQGKTYFDLDPEQFAMCTQELVKAGVNLLGGCCGTTPEHIKALKTQIKKIKPIVPIRSSISALSSARSHIILDNKQKLKVVGECINPTGKRELQKQLRQGKLTLVRSLAYQQQSHGAQLLDVNAGSSGFDEVKIMEKIISLLSVNSDLPLVIDSSNELVMEKALRLYPGRALINSISAEPSKIKNLLPVAAKYGAMCILLPLNKKEVPKKFKRRRQIIEKIFKKAKKMGFSKNDLVIDGLIMTISSYSEAAVQTLKTIKWASHVLGVNTICGLSNISFGMPRRDLINGTFLSLLKKNGLSMVISNPLQKFSRVNKYAQAVLMGKDKNAGNYIAYCQKNYLKKSNKKIKPVKPQRQDISDEIYSVIKEGNRQDIRQLLVQAVKLGKNPLYLVDKVMIPAINKVGDLFDKKEYFLPQLIASAETMQIAFKYLEPYLNNLKKEKKHKKQKKNVIILATVKGDIHDIGKNIVSLMLKNHGFYVVDLGKDVSSAKIVKEIAKYQTPIVGLSALMTTTMVNMKDVIEKCKQKKIKCKFIVGGAVITASYAHSIGAEYAKDSVQAVKVAQNLLRNKS
ncbi:MAG: homocysteine S-methyltransferase family protein [Candidatus Omnitrophota bacterium]